MPASSGQLIFIPSLHHRIKTQRHPYTRSFKCDAASHCSWSRTDAATIIHTCLLTCTQGCRCNGGALPFSRATRGMTTLMTALAGLCATGLFAYLFYALIKPERF
jgi:K+-transporting ATPase KdpF subunit